MYEVLFRNKWVVLALVVVVLAGTQYFVGGSDEAASGARDEFVAEGDDMRDRDNAFEPEAAQAAMQPQDLDGFYENSDADFLSDDEFSDDADSFDPTPIDDQGNYVEGASFDEEFADGPPGPDFPEPPYD